MKRFILVLVLILPIQSWSLTEDEVRSRVEAEIAQIHPRTSGTFWKDLGPTASAIIIAMYEASSTEYVRRLRLLGGLAQCQQNEQSTAFLKEQLKSSGKDRILRDTAIEALGNAAGVSEAETIRGYLDHEDPHTRVAAGKVLKRIASGVEGGSPEIEAWLAQFRTKEKTPWVVTKVDDPRSLKLDPREVRQVSTSEEGPSDEFLGKWSGVWLKPKPKQTGFEVKELSGLIRRSSKAPLKFEAVFTLAGVGWEWEQDKGKAREIQGKWLTLAPKAAKKSYALKARVEPRADAVWLELDLDGGRETIWLSRPR
jgi:hypothetical protein